MKRIIALFLCAVLTFALSAAAFAEGDDLIPPRVLAYNGGDYMDICFDGVDEGYFRRFSEIYDPDGYPFLYELGFEYGTEENPDICSK